MQRESVEASAQHQPVVPKAVVFVVVEIPLGLQYLTKVVLEQQAFMLNAYGVCAYAIYEPTNTQATTIYLLKLMELKDKFGGMLNSMSGMMGQNGGEDIQKKLFSSMDGMKTKIEEVNKQFKDATKTTFVAVCIPEFLSMYETERLAIELAKQEIDIHNIVINQVLFPNPSENCKKCVARRKMQDKYLTQIKEIYDDFHLVINPQLDDEVRGMESLKYYGSLLFNGYKPEWEK